MAVKADKKKPRTSEKALPAGVKPWRGPIDPKLARLIREDGAVVSGGRNLRRNKG